MLNRVQHLGFRNEIPDKLISFGSLARREIILSGMTYKETFVLLLKC
jgi:hypothetical protein